VRHFRTLGGLESLYRKDFNMDTQDTQVTTLPTSVQEQAWFYAMRPDWLESDEQREAFQAQYPELVARNADCWQQEAVQA
jgi:hypothetical protein